MYYLLALVCTYFKCQSKNSLYIRQKVIDNPKNSSSCNNNSPALEKLIFHIV